MRHGDLDRVIDIEQNTPSTDGNGAVQPSWSTLYSGLRASKRDVTGRQRIEGAAVTPEVETMFKIHYRTGITAHDCRVVYDSANYDIVHVAELGRREALELQCKRRVG